MQTSFTRCCARHFVRMGSTSTASTRGALIVFEGCDRSGKTTQCQQLVKSLNSDKIDAEYCRFPDRSTTIGKMISSYLENKAELEDHVVHLLFTANRWEAKNKMLEKLERGTTLIVDRYSYSGVAFSAAKQDMDIEWCKKPEVGLPEPDAVIYLTLAAEAAAQRGAFGDERYEKLAFQKKVAENYQQLMDSNWTEVDADKGIEELQSELRVLVNNILLQPRANKVGQLWTKALLGDDVTS